MTSDFPDELREKILTDRVLRRSITRESHYWFFHCYFSHYVEYPTAPFQREIFGITEDNALKLAVITAFRGSAKSTIVSLSYPLWAILGRQQKKFVLLLGQTQAQARQHLKNLKEEIERNTLLRADLGPFEEREDEWHSFSIVLPALGARITAASTETSVRGLRHGPHRPDLIICDDIEDLQSVKTRESRDKTYHWITGEVIPAGSPRTKVICIGNLLHEDCLLKRLQEHIENNSISGVYKEFPLLNDKNECLWEGKYPTGQSIEEERKRMGSEAAWQREFQLHIISDAGRVIHPQWIKYYDELPSEDNGWHLYNGIGIDLAISQSSSADYTAMVAAKLYRDDKDLKIYVLPNPINSRLTAMETLDQARNLADSLGSAHLFVEEVGYQGALIEHLDKDGYYVEGAKTKGQDKRARLAAVSHMVESGTILFPREGAEHLIMQLVNFGVEKHDDLSDAFAILMLKAAEERYCSMGMIIIA